MRFGVCAAPERAADLSTAGYDFVEWPLRSTVGDITDGEYAELRKLTDRLPIAPEAWNVMLPPSIRVVGPEADHNAMARYLDVAFPRAAELGGSVVVFGSGGSRRAPEGWPHEQALRQFEEACLRAGEAADRWGITIAIEPLNRGETNLVNTVAEGAVVVTRVSHPAVKLLSDLYHVYKEREAYEDTAAAGDLLAHVHVAAPEDRTMPLADRGGDALVEYFAALHQAGYDARISVECSGWGIEEAAAGLAFLRHAWTRTSSASTRPE